MMRAGYDGYAASNMVIVSIDEYDKAKMRGRLCHLYMEEADGKEFSGVIQMIQIMDDFFDSIHMPMRSMEERHFVNRKVKDSSDKGRCNESENVSRQPLQKQEIKNMAIKSGERATFVIHVCYRQNASWQGTVLWVDEKKRINFRSALELIKLMDRALNGLEKDT